MTKSVVLVIASNGFQSKEYSDTKYVLEQAGIQVITASDKAEFAISTNGDRVQVDLLISDIQTAKYYGIFLIGGPGVRTCFYDNKDLNKILHEAFALQKPYGAICIAPRVLAMANLLYEKKATCWDVDHATEAIFKKHDVIFINEAVVVDGNIVTANGPMAATAFGEAIVSLYKS